MKDKTFSERYSDEQLTDNSRIEKCKQCKNCIFQSDGTVWSNDYQKSCCAMFQYPQSKPIGVIKNIVNCEYYEKQKFND